MSEFEQSIDSITIVPSSGGRFEVTVDGDLIYSKVATGRHAEYEDVASKLRSRT